MKKYSDFIHTPALWNNVQFGIEQFAIPEFNLANFTPSPIPQNLRLGHQVEYIFLQLLQQHQDYEVLANNLQVKKGNNTIGELDFLVRYRESIYHIELTYKFYLIDTDITEPLHRLVGPNRGDAFFAKLEKTKHKQLPLLYSQECASALSQLNINTGNVLQRVCFLGQLFVPLNNTKVSIYPLNSECVIGYWCRMEDFEGVSFRESEYYIPQKNEWIDTPYLKVVWQSYSDTLQEINTLLNNKRSPMLWKKNLDGGIDKLFVVWW